jgi:uncharacterized surface protein with fasciclin (FAS1) repeats
MRLEKGRQEIKMKLSGMRIILVGFLAIALLSLGFWSQSLAGGQKDIVDTAVGAGSFKTLVKAVQAAGLAGTLKGKGPFTVFAPTDAAFGKLPKGTLETLVKPENKAKLTAILTYHVVPKKLMAKDVKGMKSAKTVNGKDLSFSVKDGAVMVDGAKVIKADIVTSNGVIHVIDSVVIPK